MADEKEFAKELNALIKRYIVYGCATPKTSLRSWPREANLCLWAYTTSRLMMYLEGKPRG